MEVKGKFRIKHRDGLKKIGIIAVFYQRTGLTLRLSFENTEGTFESSAKDSPKGGTFELRKIELLFWATGEIKNSVGKVEKRHGKRFFNALKTPDKPTQGERPF